MMRISVLDKRAQTETKLLDSVSSGSSEADVKLVFMCLAASSSLNISDDVIADYKRAHSVTRVQDKNTTCTLFDRRGGGVVLSVLLSCSISD